MVALARDVVAQALDAHVRPVDGEAASVVGVLGLGLVGDRREAPALDDERLRVERTRDGVRDLPVVPDDGRGGVDRAVCGGEAVLSITSTRQGPGKDTPMFAWQEASVVNPLIATGLAVGTMRKMEAPLLARGTSWSSMTNAAVPKSTSVQISAVPVPLPM